MPEDNAINECADILSTMGHTKNPEQISVMANLLAIAITKGRSQDQLNLIGSFISLVGSLVQTIAAQKSFCESKQEKMEQIRELKKQIKELENDLL